MSCGSERWSVEQNCPRTVRRAIEETVLDLLSRSDEYQVLFQQSFGDGGITIERVAEAIACFERTIVGGSSRFDVFMKGKREIFQDSEWIGLDLYRRETRCMNCHHGPLFSDGRFHDVGLSYYGRKFEDLGRYRVTNDPQDVGRFRTPSLRDITQTTPLMHNGLFELTGVLNMYNAGMPTLKPKESQRSDERFPRKSPHLKPLGLNKQDLEDLWALAGVKNIASWKTQMSGTKLPLVGFIWMDWMKRVWKGGTEARRTQNLAVERIEVGVVGGGFDEEGPVCHSPW